MARIPKKHMSREEIEIFDDIYEYVRTHVMGYDQNQSLSQTMVLRLKGLITNKFVENYYIEDTANYPYLVVLNTFKFCKPDIERALRSNSFKSENHKFNYVIKVVESNLNNVYMRMKNAEKSKETTKNVDMTTATHVGAEYQKKTEKTSKRLEKFW